MITATDLEVRAGARILLSPDGPDLRVQPGDRIGLVGRNGAGKTTTMRILAGESEPYAGSIVRSGEIGYLPQDPKEGDLEVLARDRVLSARGLDALLTDLEKQQALMAEVADDDARDRAIRRYGQLEERFVALGGYGAESEAGRICASLGLPERVLTQQLRTLSGGQRRRVELARILFAASEGGAGASGSHTTLLLDEPTNHLDADSVGWLRDFLRSHNGGLVIISHNVELLADVVNKVWFLDAVRGEVDVYNMGWQKYLDARATDEQRRRRERANAERKATALRTQAAKLGAKATKAVAAQNMLRRADRMMAALDEERAADKVARINSHPGPVRAHTAGGQGAEQDVRIAGSVHRCRPGHRSRVAGCRAGAQRRRQDHAAPSAGRHRAARHGWAGTRTRLANRLFRAGARHARQRRTVWQNIRHAAPEYRRTGSAWPAGCVHVQRSAARPTGRHAVRWREDPARAGRSGGVHGQRAVARRTDQQPRSRVARAGARRAAQLSGRGGARDARPGRGRGARSATRGAVARWTEDYWSEDYRDLIELA